MGIGLGIGKIIGNELLDEHFSGTGRDSSFDCLLCLVLRAVAMTARTTTKQDTNFIPKSIFTLQQHTI